MTAKHLLGIEIETTYGMVSWTLTCCHAEGEFWTIDTDTGERINDQCWAPDWFNEVGFEDSAAGDWPNEITFPCPVRVQWDDALLLYFDETNAAPMSTEHVESVAISPDSATSDHVSGRIGSDGAK